MGKGIFITVEGPEGAGKTTILKIVASELKEKGYPVIYTREPGGIPIAEKIREIILDKSNIEMDPKTEALLYAAARRQHLVEKIIPEINKGKIVLCDRFIDASIVYQGYARGIGMDPVYLINEFAVDHVMPDLTVYFDIQPEIGLKRIQQHRETEVNRLDLEGVQFHRKVREGYKLLLRKYPERIKELDADRPLEEVKKDTEKMIMDYLQKRSFLVK
ncbi:dTMP kinase [Fervidibacillus halotolerans]|uniref:Thymidylate kinase n=1 Tax=Fervidibacillus halotolerans TaxID=2980027 RepID=A0A9E8LZA6_9BACI|nr:dTMP kinase [Fervidibacillus halotolerans]WAA12321.1 dTMP kinase [Fervidibacillus halotolerans]